MRRLLTTLLACALALTACGGDDDDTADADPTTTSAASGDGGATETTAAPTDGGGESPDATAAPEELTASFRGVTADTITIGLHIPDLAAIRDIVNLDHGDYVAAYEAVAADINANGGVLGRQIEFVAELVSPIDTAGSDAACVRLTEDEEVFIVLGGPVFDQVLCYVADHEMAVIGGMMSDARLAAAQAPWFVYDGNTDRNFEAGTTALIEAGEYDGATLAVISDELAEDVMNDAVVPLLEDAGIDVAETAVLPDTAGDTAANLANVAVIAERLQSAGVDTVLFVGQSISGFLLGITPTDFRPHVTNLDRDTFQAYTQSEGTDLSVIEGAVTTGAMDFVWDDPEFAHCRELAEAAQPGLEIIDTRGVPDLPEPWVAPRTACAQLALFVDIATAAGPDLNYDTFRAAGEALGEWQVPAGPVVTFSAETPDGDPPRFLFRWDPETGRFVQD